MNNFNNMEFNLENNIIHDANLNKWEKDSYGGCTDNNGNYYDRRGNQRNLTYKDKIYFNSDEISNIQNEESNEEEFSKENIEISSKNSIDENDFEEYEDFEEACIKNYKKKEKINKFERIYYNFLEKDKFIKFIIKDKNLRINKNELISFFKKNKIKINKFKDKIVQKGEFELEIANEKNNFFKVIKLEGQKLENEEELNIGLDYNKNIDINKLKEKFEILKNQNKMNEEYNKNLQNNFKPPNNNMFIDPQQNYLNYQNNPYPPNFYPYPQNPYFQNPYQQNPYFQNQPYYPPPQFYPPPYYPQNNENTNNKKKKKKKEKKENK